MPHLSQFGRRTFQIRQYVQGLQGCGCRIDVIEGGQGLRIISGSRVAGFRHLSTLFMASRVGRVSRASDDCLLCSEGLVVRVGGPQGLGVRV